VEGVDVIQPVKVSTVTQIRKKQVKR